MKPIHPLINLSTSVSLPRATYRRLCGARKIFARHGIIYSDQEMYRRLLKYFLKNWRGKGRKTNGLRRYNADGKSYVIRPLYINQVIHAAVWQRAIHSGESLSRILDFAIRIYLPRLLETLLAQSQDRRGISSKTAYWEIRYGKRNKKYSDFFINYTCTTRVNCAGNLVHCQETRILSKMAAFTFQI
jgi:hypothetical protein